MDVNKTIHEAMGLEWADEDKSVWNCKCDCIVPTYPTFRLNKHVAPCEHAEPDYTDPIHYCVLMDWISEAERADYFDTHINRSVFAWLTRSRQEQITLISEAIEAGVLSCTHER